MKYTIFILLIIFFSGHAVEAQTDTLSYGLQFRGDRVGSLTAIRTKTGKNAILYDVKSETVIHFLGKTTIKTSLKVAYRNGVLQNSQYSVTKNGSAYKTTTINRVGQKYHMDYNGDKSMISTPIYYSAARLYFEEPDRVKTVFAELEGVDHRVHKIKKDVYEIDTSENGKTNTYIYKNGILQEGVFEHTLYSFKLFKNK
jgi:hypothetical protein